EALGKGILLLHDIHPATAAALPGLLQQLKASGFHIVQVVPAASYEIAMAKKPKAITTLPRDERSSATAWITKRSRAGRKRRRVTLPTTAHCPFQTRRLLNPIRCRLRTRPTLNGRTSRHRL